MKRDQLQRAAEILSGSNLTVALTGAGISVESGIPPFRGPGGVWEKFDPMEYAHIDAFRRDPKKVWTVLLSSMKQIMDAAAPNDAHIGLFRLEEMGILKTVITQNVDGLHQAAGSRDVIEFHGNFAWHYCMECGARKPGSAFDLLVIPPVCNCGGIFRPDCIFFGETIPPDHLNRSKSLSIQCETMIVVGTSATVYPSASMPVIAKQTGATIIEINKEPSSLTHSVTDIFLKGPAAETVRELVAEVERSR